MRFFTIICFCVISTLAQKNEDTLYAKGLQACLEKELASYGSFSNRDLRNVVVAYDFYLTRNLPTMLGEISISYLSDGELVERYKKLPKDEKERGIPYMKVFPISDKDNKLFFAYDNYWFTYDEKGGFFSEKKLIYKHSLEGGCHAEIGFDPTEGKFFIKSVKLWGV